MSELRAAGSLDVIGALRAERDAFVGLLAALEPAEWELPTECPAWSVKGVALHVLGDDFSLLSRQRDSATNSLELMAQEKPGWDFRRLLDGFNEAWVHRASFMSTRLVRELLELTGQLTSDFYAAVDPDVLGEPVFFVGPAPAPYWMIAAREYAERWIHHLQVARATAREGPVQIPLVAPAVAAIMRGFPAAMAALPAPPGEAVSFVLDGSGEAWTVVNEDGGWRLYDGVDANAAVRLGLSPETAAGLFSRGLDRETILSKLEPTGDANLGTAVRDGLAAVFARTE